MSALTFVYFIATEDRSMVKIGFSTSPPNRLSSLQAWSPQKLEILAAVPGRPQDERALHARYLAQYSHKEWFRSTPEMLADAAAIARFGELPTAFRGSDKEPDPIAQKHSIRNTPEWKAKVSKVHKARWVKEKMVRAFQRLLFPFLDKHQMAAKDFNTLVGHDVVYQSSVHGDRWSFVSAIPHYDRAERLIAEYEDRNAAATPSAEAA